MVLKCVGKQEPFQCQISNPDLNQPGLNMRFKVKVTQVPRGWKHPLPHLRPVKHYERHLGRDALAAAMEPSSPSPGFGAKDSARQEGPSRGSQLVVLLSLASLAF